MCKRVKLHEKKNKKSIKTLFFISLLHIYSYTEGSK